ncbi:TlpA disulfide reductase family protein [Zoogloeaceae bacterium G21618-S1]|nr:TlpA disulfide reductase family protein [Zoogloeaceae bacterium G21618-S1]
MIRLPQSALIVLVAIAAGALGYWTSRNTNPSIIRPLASASSPASPDTVSPAEGARLLTITLPDADGKMHALDALKDTVVVANFWATWCPPCRKEIPDFSDVSERYHARGVRFVGLSLDTPERVAAFRDEMKVPYPLLIGDGSTVDLAAKLGNPAGALPFTVILDRQGQIRHLSVGGLSKSDLEGKISALLP